MHIPQDLPQDDPKQRQPDISLAQAKLNGWEPKIQLRDGLITTIDYFEKLRIKISKVDILKILKIFWGINIMKKTPGQNLSLLII